MKIEAIRLEQQKIFKELHKFTDFYLVGGTALALQIGHRVSVDFGLFYPKDLPENLAEKTKRIFLGSKFKIFIRHSEQLSVFVNDVRLDFVKYVFPLILKPIIFERVPMAPVLEIAAMKAYALGYRGTFKDYVDLYFILKDGFATLKEIKDLADKKYGDDFNFRLFLEQLVYLSDVTEEQQKNVEFLREKIDKDGLRKFFKREVKKVKI